MSKPIKDDPILNKFIEYLKEAGYSSISDPLNTRHSDMYAAFKAGVTSKSFDKRSNKSLLRKATK